MKKKILITMVLFVCVFGLTGCSLMKLNNRTLEVALKEEKSSTFEILKSNILESGMGISEVDIIGEEFILYMISEEYEEIIEDEEMKDYFTEMLDDAVEYADISMLILFIKSFDVLANDYDGNPILKIVLQTPDGDELYTGLFDENGTIKKKKAFWE